MTNALKVLLVDDSKVSRMMSGAMVKKYRSQASVIEAADGAAALLLLDEHAPDIGIIDMNMPGMSGLDLVQCIQQRLPQTRLALLTANGQDSIRDRATILGIHYFRKPITEPLIVQILEVLAPESK